MGKKASKVDKAMDVNEYFNIVFDKYTRNDPYLKLSAKNALIKRGYNPLSFRFMCLNSHYRKQLVFSFDSLNSAEQAYLKLKNKISLIKDEGELSEGDFDKYKNMFIEYITNDLNTANAITLLYDLLKDDTVNGHTKIELVRSFDKVLSLDLLPEVKEVRSDHEHIMKLIETRNEAKKAKNFELADAIRDELLSKGIALVDTREGTIYKEV